MEHFLQMIDPPSSQLREFLLKLQGCFGEISAFLVILCEFLFNNKIFFNSDWKLLFSISSDFFFF